MHKKTKFSYLVKPHIKDLLILSNSGTFMMIGKHAEG